MITVVSESLRIDDDTKVQGSQGYSRLSNACLRMLYVCSRIITDIILIFSYLRPQNKM